MIDAGKRACGNCRYYDKDEAKQGICRRYPPTAVATPLVSPTIAGARPNVEWVVQAVLPPAREGTPACGEFAWKDERLN